MLDTLASYLFPADPQLRAVGMALIGTLATAGLALAGAVVAACLLYRSTISVARRNLLVGTVTAERAVWRSDLRAATVELSEATLLALDNPTVELLAKAHRQRLAVRLRLNPSRSDKHRLDREISDALHALGLALQLHRGVEVHTQLLKVETTVQQLLKQEWDKSKGEAKTGVLAT